REFSATELQIQILARYTTTIIKPGDKIMS
ncbi:unnamed protein product, partial [marine sediment metagenome]